MHGAEAIGWRCEGVPRYRDIGGRSEENASLATQGAYGLGRVVVGRQNDGK